MTAPLLIEVPQQLMTERLLLRLPQLDDAKAIQTAVNESLPELRLWMDWAREAQTLRYTEDYIRHVRARFMAREELTYQLVERESGRFLGNSSIHTIDWQIPRVEIGYWLRTSAVGHGYMTEAVKALMMMAFETLKAVRVEIRCDANNSRSAHVAERAGFQLEARLARHRRTTGGELSDTLIYVRLV